MLIHPQFDPIALSLGPVAIRWYGLMYLVAFLSFLALGRYRIKRGAVTGWKVEEVDDLVFYGALGVVLGGRLGYIVFYKLSEYLANPLEIFAIWHGGMSFHGGLLGVLFALWLWGRKTGRHFLQVGDFVAPLVPLGLAAGRMGNFINGELWGRVTQPDAFWAMVFPQANQVDAVLASKDMPLQEWFIQYGGLPRHPSQLYQFALEGLALFVILWLFTRRPRPMGMASAVFLMGYGAFRFIAEFAREPDDFLGLLAGQLSMGQWLSLPMVAAGGLMLVWSVRRRG